MPSVSIEHFISFLVRLERSPHTIKNYRYDLAAFSKWFSDTTGDEFEPDRVTPELLLTYKHVLREHQGLKPNSVNRKLATLNSFFRWAADIGLVGAGRRPSVPQAIRETRQGPRWLDRREQRALIRAVQQEGSQRDLAIITVLLKTGLRVQELCALTWQDIRMLNRKGRLTVRNGKGAKQRQVPLNRDAQRAFLALGYREYAGENKPVFLGQRGPLTPRGIQNMFRKYAKTARLDAISPHSLRHTFCKNLVNAGVSLEKVAALVGHESLDTTRRYCEPSLKDLEHAVKLIEEDG